MFRTLSGILFCCSLALLARGGEGSLVLDERAYFRHYFQIDWDQIRQDPCFSYRELVWFL